MKFLLQGGEGEDLIYYYPVLANYPFTPRLAKYYLELYDKESEFWKYLFNCMESNLTIDVLLYIHNFQELGLPKWVFKCGDKMFQAGLKPELLSLHISPQKVTLMQNSNKNTLVNLDLDILDRRSHVATIMKNIFPYLSFISIFTEKGHKEIYLQ